LYHYTTLATLDALLPHPSKQPPGLKEWWATSARYMNDPEEYLFGRRAVGREAGRRSDSFWSELSNQLLDEVSFKNPDMGMNVYFVCFSTRRDDLGQWRAYGANGGVAIGFRKSDLETGRTEPDSDDSMSPALVPVLYGRSGRERFLAQGEPTETDGLGEFCRSVLEQAVPPAMLPDALRAVLGQSDSGRSDPLTRNYDPEKLSVSLSDVLNALPLSFLARKDEAYREENEVRLLSAGASFDVRISGTTPRPYQKIVYAEPLVPCEIVLGPTVSDEASYRAIRLLSAIRFRDYGAVEVRRSEIGYRVF
jgi:hypothetical protein